MERSERQGPAQMDVDALRGLLRLTADFPDDDVRARYILSSNWLRDRGAAAAARLATPAASPSTEGAGPSTDRTGPSRRPEPPHALLRIDEVAERTGVSVETLRFWRKSGTGPPFTKLGRRLVCRRVDLDRWVDAQFGAA